MSILFLFFLSIISNASYIHAAASSNSSASSSGSDSGLQLRPAPGQSSIPIQILTLSPRAQKLTPPSSSLSTPLPHTPQGTPPTTLARDSDDDSNREHEVGFHPNYLDNDLPMDEQGSVNGHHLLASPLFSTSLARLIIAHHTGLTDKNEIDKHPFFNYIKKEIEHREEHDSAGHQALITRSGHVRDYVVNHALTRRRALRNVPLDSASVPTATPESPTSQEISAGLKEADSPSEYKEIFAKAAENIYADKDDELATLARTDKQKDALFWSRLTMVSVGALVGWVVALGTLGLNFYQVSQGGSIS